MSQANSRNPRRRAGLAKRLAAGLVNLAVVIALGGFAAAALVRYSPGFDVDENSWNPRISEQTRAAQHARLQRETRLPLFYARYLSGAARGEFGRSELFGAPVSQLLKERAPASARIVGWGVAGGLLLGGVLAWLAVWPRRTGFTAAASGAAGLLLAIPPAVLGLAFFLWEAPIGLAMALVLAPRVFASLRALLAEIHASPALLAARARGLGGVDLALRYVVRPAAPQLVAIAGVAAAMAFGALIPIEALCDVPGLGQLAWKAALARDLPVLSALALTITFVVASVQTLGDTIG